MLLAAAAGVAVQAATITFEEAIPGPGNVTNQYCVSPVFNQGVRFLEGGRIAKPGVETASGSHALVVVGSQEFDQTKRLVISFTAPQTEVSLRVGLDRHYEFDVHARLSAYTTLEPPPGGGNVVANEPLGRSPTPITQFLFVNSTQIGGPIRSVVLEYAGESGSSRAAYEVIDDLIFDNPGPQCGNDTILPDVEILRPSADGQALYSTTFQLSFRARDRGSDVVEVRVSYLDATGGRLNGMAVTPPTGGGEPPEGWITWNFWTHDIPRTARTILVEALDAAGNLGFRERRINFVPEGTQANLWVGAVEITQGIQTAVLEQPQRRLSKVPFVTQPTAPFGGTPPLVANRTTVLRVYPRMDGPAGAPNLWATARLYCYVAEDFYLRRTPHPTRPWIAPRQGPVEVRPGYDLDLLRRNLASGWVFVLPREWTGPGKVILKVETVAGPETPECPGCEDGANSLDLYGLWFDEVPAFTSNVRLHPLRRLVASTPLELHFPQPDGIQAQLDYIRRTYPVDETTVARRNEWLFYVENPDPLKSLDDRADDLLDFLGAKFLTSFFLYQNGLGFCALVDTNYPWAGVARSSQGYAFARALTNQVDATAHEVGHTTKLNHAGSPPGHGDECKTSCDDDWPYPHGTIGPHFGFDVLNLTVVPPFGPGCASVDCATATHDLMSYGGNTWISSRNWIRLFNWFTRSDLPYPRKPGLMAAASRGAHRDGPRLQSPHPAATVYPRSLLVAGRQEGVGTWSLRPAFELDAPLSDEDPSTGSHVLELADESGRVLVQRFFEPQSDHADPPEDGPVAVLSPKYSALLPLPDGVATITLRQGNTVLAAIARNPVPPGVRLLSPTAAGFEGAPDNPRIRWTEEPGGRDGSLSYLVQYSARTNTQGQPDWQTLAAYLTEAELPVSLDGLPGSDAARVRVLASDGLSTAAAISDPFVVPNHPPEVEIISRGGGDRMIQGDRVVMRGTAMDLEDGLLVEPALAWRSHLDGPLATGNTLAIDRLQPGVHEITLEARDTQGAIGTATITLEVIRAPNHQPVAAATGPASVRPGHTVLLDGSGSRDADGDPLTYRWSLVLSPPGSTAQLTDPSIAAPGFNADLPGEYAVLLAVHDGEVASLPAQVNVSVPVHPLNDAFADAYPIVGATGAVPGYNVDATVEAQEPADELAGRTVWWRWQSPGTTNAFFEIADATFLNPLLSVYRGDTLDSLVWIAAGSEAVPPVARRAEFRAEAGVTYWVRVGGESGAAGDFTLRWGNMPIPVPNPVAWYPLTGHADDASGRGNHGTVAGPTLTANRFGQPGAAYRFTGARNERIELPAAAFNPRDAFTIALWARPADINGWHMLFTKWDDLARRYFFHFATEGGRLQFSVSSTGTDFGNGLNDPRILPLHVWTHCVAVANRQTGELKLYRNGQLAAARTLAPFSLPDLPDTGVRVGGKVDGNFPFNGVLDDVLFFDRALTDREIAELFAAQLERDDAPPRPAVLADDFATGVAPARWTLIGNSPAYLVDTATSAFGLSRAAGGVPGFAFAGLELAYRAGGDFDARVDFRNAVIKRVNGAPGNQIHFNASFGGQTFGIVRSDEVTAPGDNVHVWADPPPAWFGALPWTATNGTLRLKRSGTLVMAFIDDTLVHLDNHNTNTVGLGFTLQNNGTTDATAVWFDDFRLEAERLIPPWQPPAITTVTIEDGRLRFLLTTPDAELPVRIEVAADLGAPEWREVSEVQFHQIGPGMAEAVMTMPIPVPKPGEPLQRAWFYRGTMPVPIP